MGATAAGRVVLRPRAHNARFPQGGFLGEMQWVWALVLLAALGSARAERDCRVSSFRVKENFDKARVRVRPGGPGLLSLPSRQPAVHCQHQTCSHLFAVCRTLVRHGQEGP